MNIVLAAEEAAGLQMLRALARTTHRVVAVLAALPKPGDTNASVWTMAQVAGFTTWPAPWVKDPCLADRLRSEKVDIFLNVHSLYIVHRDVLATPRLGAFNLHPGPLPRYAGLNAVSWAILRGEETHGVTIHKMEPAVDMGPIVYQSLFPIEESETALSLSFKCVREGVRLMLKLLEVASIAPSNIPLHPQDHRQREYFGREVPNNGWVRWMSPAKRVFDFVRAFDYLPFRSPWGCSKTQLGNLEVGVVKTKRSGLPCDASPGTIGHRFDSGVQVACLDEWLLVERLKIDDKYVSASEILKPGDHLGNHYDEHAYESAHQYRRYSA